MSDVASAEDNAPMPGLDLDALREFLHPRIAGGLGGPLRADLLAGGRSNLTYGLSDGQHAWVLRRPPLGHVLETAHDMSREFRVMRALEPTAVPVPSMATFCDDPSIIGAPFYVMERVDGVTYRDREDFASLRPADRGALGRAFVDVLAALACVDYGSVGLAEFGRPEGYAARQVRRWTKQLESSSSRPVAGIGRLAEALSSQVPPAQRSSIVHGDFRLDNALINRDDASNVLAIIDWEMSTLGDPLTDLGMFYLFWEGWQGLENPIAATPVDFEGFPPWPELRDRYVAATGLDLDSFDWYAAFAYYKLAVICEGIHYRFIKGMTVGEGFERMGELVEPLVERGLTTLHP
jgi:aminoglycoside phosphotransferase (APT) family kinase protein